MAKMTEQQIFARMSGHFLCQHLPDDWADWPEEKLDKFFEDNAWEPLEYWPVNDVYELIDSLTRDVMNLMGVDGTDQLL
jgi:hypothetical protein